MVSSETLKGIVCCSLIKASSLIQLFALTLHAVFRYHSLLAHPFYQ